MYHTSEMQLRWQRMCCLLTSNEELGGAGRGTGRTQLVGEAQTASFDDEAAENAAIMQHAISRVTSEFPIAGLLAVVLQKC